MTNALNTGGGAASRHVHHLKPGCGHTYKDSEAFAAAKGGRLLTCELLGVADVVKGDSLIRKAEKCWACLRG